jgi:hypothetical protein
MATDLETNKATVRQFFGAVERRDFKVFDQIVIENYAHNIEGMPIGREGLSNHAVQHSLVFPVIKPRGVEPQPQQRKVRCYICAAPCDPMLVTTTTSEHIGHWIKMRRSLARFSALEPSLRTRYSGGFIITTPGSRFRYTQPLDLGICR